MYQYFYIPKRTGTYADALEAYGVAFTIREILERLNIDEKRVSIKDSGNTWIVESQTEFSQTQLASISFFPILRYLKKEATEITPTDIRPYNYPAEKQNFESLRNQRKVINESKEFSKEEKKRKLTDLSNSETHKSISVDFDVYREIVRNPYPAYKTLFDNLYQNRTNFDLLLKEVLDFYQLESKVLSKKQRPYSVTEKVTSQQLYSPNQGKGLNRSKADKLTMENLDGYWISEMMKVHGAVKTMFCQYVKVGSGMDLKIYVPAFKDITSTQDIAETIKPFKAQLKSSSPVKLDILNLLSFAEHFIKHTEIYKEQTSYSGKIKKSFSGFHSVYQKDLGQNRAVVNISFLETPGFINLNEGAIWTSILPELRTLISRIEEQGDSINGLKKFRDFLSSGRLNDFFDFSFWYSRFIVSQLSQEHFYIIPFTSHILNLIFKSMDANLNEIIQNKGFQAIANAIKKSTISLQYTPKNQRQFEIQYGLSQTLQIKSKSKTDLATFVGNFATSYNVETARKKEAFLKKGTQNVPIRSTIKAEELSEVYSLINNYDSQLVGALLASYGFALNEKDKTKSSDSEESVPDEEL